MQLTGRQQSFLKDFLDLYREENEALHYVMVAERLGVGKVTAYDMLRILEEKGLVSSEYVLPPKRSGAGRSTIVFRPTTRAADAFSDLAGQEWEQTSWEEVKDHILQTLRDEKGGDYEELLDELLLRLDEQSSPLVATAEMVTAVVIGVRQLQEDVTSNGFTQRLEAMGFPGELGLEALGGLTVGLSFVERINRKLIVKLLRQVKSYEANLARLSKINRRRLVDFAQEVWQVTNTPAV